MLHASHFHFLILDSNWLNPKKDLFWLVFQAEKDCKL